MQTPPPSTYGLGVQVSVHSFSGCECAKNFALFLNDLGSHMQVCIKTPIEIHFMYLGIRKS